MIALVLIMCIGVLIYTLIKKNTVTREEYALKALAAIISLVTVGLASISSKTGIVDELFSLISSIMGHPLPEAVPAPLSEKTLMVFLVAFGIHAIVKSHENWTGRLSADEIERQRMKKTNSLIFQGIDEGIRLISKKPERSLHLEEKRYDPVALPEEPNLIWHSHVRELFELWNPKAKFKFSGDYQWDPVHKCWHGHDGIRNHPLFLFCSLDRPDRGKLDQYQKHASSINKNAKYSTYIIFKNNNGVLCKDLIKDEEGQCTLISEEYLYNNIVDFTDYFSYIESKVEKDKFPNTTITLQEIYTASEVSYDAAGKKIAHADLLEYLGEWSSKPAGQQIAVLGEYGQGKSTAALMFVFESLRNNNNRANGRIPILLELRGKSPANLLPHELLAAWGQRYDIHASALMKLLINGRLILILEGFDEMSNVSNLESRLSHFRSLWSLSYPSSKIIFTGRKNLFFEDRELQIIFQDADVNGSASKCETLYLRPFSFEKIEKSLRWVDAQKKREILIAAKLNKQIREVLSRPSLLFIVASLWDELRVLFDEGRITSAVVIDKFITHSYERQRQKEKELHFMTLTTTERRYFHEGIAVYMAKRELPNQITNVDLMACLERLYKAYPKGVNISDSVSMETSRSALTIRIPDPEEALQAISTDVRTHGILVNEVGLQDVFRFAHKSFYELLVAKAHAYNLLNFDSLFYGSIKEANDGGIGYAGKQPEILKFFSELIFMKMEKKTHPMETALSIYDLFNGFDNKNKKIIYIFSRWVFLVYLRIAFNSKLITISFFSVQGFLLASIAWKTSVVINFMDNYSTLSKYKYIATGSVEATGSLGVLGIFTLVCVVIFSVGASLMNSILRKRAELWAAVLLANDRSLNVNIGEVSIIRLLGKVSASELMEKTKIKYQL